MQKNEKSISVEFTQEISENHEKHRKSLKTNQKRFTTIHFGVIWGPVRGHPTQWVRQAEGTEMEISIK